jgi:hypothetical protein
MKNIGQKDKLSKNLHQQQHTALQGKCCKKNCLQMKLSQNCMLSKQKLLDSRIDLTDKKCNQPILREQLNLFHMEHSSWIQRMGSKFRQHS